MPIRESSDGFTLLEVLVALAVGGLVVLSSTALLGRTSDMQVVLREHIKEVESTALRDRLLRELFLSVEVGGDPLPRFRGDERTMRFTSWCATGGGWLEPCVVTLLVTRGEAGLNRIVLKAGDAAPIVLIDGVRTGTFRYLSDPGDRRTWASSWGERIVAPRAVAVVADDAVLILRIGERG